MPEQTKPFVVTDRRKFTKEGELRPDADPSPEREERATTPVETVAAAPAATRCLDAASCPRARSAGPAHRRRKRSGTSRL